MTSPRRAIAFSLTTQYGVILTNLLTTAVVSRLLLPEEVGVFSIAAAFVALGQALRDFGSSEYIVQEKELTRDRIRAAFGVTLGVSWMLAALVALLAPFAGDFYNETGVGDVALILAISFLLLPFGSVTSAYHRREMNFKPMMYGRLAGAIASSTVTITCAYFGQSYMSMAWGNLAGSITTVAVLTYYRPAGFPKTPGVREIRHVFSFGGRFSLISILEQLGTAIPGLVIGKTLGMGGAGLISRTQTTTQIFSKLVMGAVSPVANAQFAKKSRLNEDLHGLYVTLVKHITVLAWPFFGGMALLAEELTLTLFGPNWLEVAPLVRIVCFGMIVHHLTSLAHRILVVTGHIDRGLRITAIMQPLRILVISLAALINLEAVAFGMAALPAIRFVLLWKDLVAVTAIKPQDYVDILGQSGLIALATVFGAWLTERALIGFDIHPLMVLLSCTLVGGIFWLVALHVLRHPFQEEVARIIAVGRKRARMGRD